MEKVVTAGFIEGPGIINSNKENAIFFEGSVMFSVCRIKKIVRWEPLNRYCRPQGVTIQQLS